MSTARYIIGDTRDATATIPDASVDLILTSPPFLALRSYLPADHPDKWREIGSEPTPAAFIDMLLELTAEWARVLTPHGSIAVELGDTYSGAGGAGGDYTDTGLRAGQEKFEGSAIQHRRTAIRIRDCGKDGGSGWPQAKSKALIPELYRVALAYGINPLTGAPSPAGQWRVRNVVTWCRPNPPVGALGDKYRPATSDMVIFCRSASRWFDLDAVRTPHKEPDDARFLRNGSGRGNQSRNDEGNITAPPNPAGAPPLDYWVIPPTGYSGSHYAVYPPELCRIPILSMCPRRVCNLCGEPRRRIVGDAEYVRTDGSPAKHDLRAEAKAPGVFQFHTSGDNTAHRVANTLGWTECDCVAPFPSSVTKYRKGVVFDPFAGSGTTLMVATGNDRDAIGIDIDERNADLAVERLGMFVTIERPEAAA